MPKAKIQTVLDKLATKNERILRVPLQEWMDFASKQIRGDLARKFKKDIAAELTDWEFIEGNGKRTLKPATLKIMQSGGNQAYKHLAIAGSFDVLNVRAIKAADKFCAKLVTNVTQKTKEGVRAYISAGIKAGESMPTIARKLRPFVGLTKPQTESIINARKLLTEKRPDLSAAQIDKRITTYTNKTHRRRMEDIARTETARAQNIGYCQGLEDVGVAEAEFQIAATDFCEDCEALNHTRYPIAEAGGIIPVHPKCRCAMLPVVGEKTISETLASPPAELRPAIPKPKLPGIPSIPKPKPRIEPGKLTVADEKVLRRYTTEEGFDAVSRAQRGLKLDPVYFEISTKEALALGDKIQAAAVKLTAKPGKAYRGLSFTTEKEQQKFLSQFKVGKTWESKTLQSTTEMKGYAQQFLEETAAGHPRDPAKGILLNIKHKTGRSLVRFSDNPDEAEILLMKGSKYKVVKIKNNEVFLVEI